MSNGDSDTPLTTALSRRYGQSNQYGNDPNHSGFATGIFDSMKTGIQATIGMKQMQNMIKGGTGTSPLKPAPAGIWGEVH